MIRDYLVRVQQLLDDYRFFFVVGAPKSGTTWIQKALDAHSEIVCAGEGHFIDKFSKNLSQLFSVYCDFQKVVNRNVYEGKGYYRPEPSSDLEFLAGSFILGAFSHLALPEGTRLIGDKTPVNVRYMRSLHRLFPKAKFINIVRDGRDTLVSTIKHAERVLRNDGRQAEIERIVPGKIDYYVSRWVESIRLASDFAERHPDLVHTVRYEDLKRDFAPTFAGVLGFLDVDASGPEVARCERMASFDRLSGGRSPGEEDPQAFFRKGVVGDWETSLTPRQLAAFNATGASWLAKLGYAD